VLEEAEPFADEADFNARQTIRRRGPIPGQPLPPPAVPIDTLDDDELGDDGLIHRRGGILAEEGDERRGLTRTMALAGIALIGVAVAAITAVALTRGGDNGVATSLPPDSTADRGSGSVVVVGSATPSPRPLTPVGSASANPPGAPSGGTQTPSSDGQTPPDSEPTATPTDEEGDEDTPEATPTAEATSTHTPVPATATATPVAPTATPPLPTATPVLVQPHPQGEIECNLPGTNPCGPPPLRVICAPDGWFIDVGRDYPNPGWPEDNSALTSGRAREIGVAGCT
jgi:hypothetical protein